MRDLHVVVPTVGRPTGAGVVWDTIAHERRLARLTIVAQGGAGVVDPALAALAHAHGVALNEQVLPQRVGAGQARHLGSLDGTEPFVAFLDDDIRFETGSLSALVDRCEREGLGGASAVVADPRNTLLSASLKTLLFRSIFCDPRPWAARSRRPQASHILSGGMTVYRRTVYAPHAAAWLDFRPDERGEDVELSFAISRDAPLAVDGTVQVRNLSREDRTVPRDPLATHLRQLDRYRAFAARHATRPVHWSAFLGVLLGVLARGLSDGAGPHFIKAVAADAAWALAQGSSSCRARRAETKASTSASA